MPDVVVPVALGLSAASVDTVAAICDVALGLVAALLVARSFRRRREHSGRRASERQLPPS